MFYMENVFYAKNKKKKLSFILSTKNYNIEYAYKCNNVHNILCILYDDEVLICENNFKS